jgi:hypothetical protein
VRTKLPWLAQRWHTPRGVRVRVSARTPAFMTQVSREFPQFLRETDKMVCLDWAMTLSFEIFCNSPFTNHPIIGRY